MGDSLTLTFSYSASPDCRTTSIDGAFGGFGANSKMTIAFFVERVPIPTVVTHTVTDGRLGAELSRVGGTTDGDLVREIVGMVTMDLSTAEALGRLISEKVEKFKTDAGVLSGVNRP